RRAAKVGRQIERLEQGHEALGAALERGAGSARRQLVDDEVALGQAALAETALHALPERQEARAKLIGVGPEPQVEAGRLELLVVERDRRHDPAVAHREAQLAIREDALTHARSS